MGPDRRVHWFMRQCFGRAYDAMLRMFCMFMFTARLRGAAYCCWRLWYLICRRAHNANVICIWLCVCVLMCRLLFANCVRLKAMLLLAMLMCLCCCGLLQFRFFCRLHLSFIILMRALPQNLRAPCIDLLWRRVCCYYYYYYYCVYCYYYYCHYCYNYYYYYTNTTTTSTTVLLLSVLYPRLAK